MSNPFFTPTKNIKPPKSRYGTAKIQIRDGKRAAARQGDAMMCAATKRSLCLIESFDDCELWDAVSLH